MEKVGRRWRVLVWVWVVFTLRHAYLTYACLTSSPTPFRLSQVFKDYEEQSYQTLMGLIEKHAGDLPHGIFTDFAAKIYKRTK